MDATSDGGYKVRTRILVFHDGKATALCPTCKQKVEVPVILGDVDDMLPKQKIFVKQA